MGLEGVELVMSWEENFDITITDAEAATIRTPRLVIDLIYQKIGGESQPAGCLSQQGFYCLRRTFTRVAVVPRSAFKPATQLANLLPPDHRKEQWRRWREAVQVRSFPTLSRPFWCQALLAVLVGGSFALFKLRVPSPSIAFLLSCGVWWIGLLLTRPLRNNFPLRYKTVGQLTKYLVGRHVHCIKSAGRKWSRQEIRMVVRESICQILGIKDDFSDDDDFVHDLGIG